MTASLDSTFAFDPFGEVTQTTTADDALGTPKAKKKSKKSSQSGSKKTGKKKTSQSRNKQQSTTIGTNAPATSSSSVLNKYAKPTGAASLRKARATAAQPQKAERTSLVKQALSAAMWDDEPSEIHNVHAKVATKNKDVGGNTRVSSRKKAKGGKRRSGDPSSTKSTKKDPFAREDSERTMETEALTVDSRNCSSTGEGTSNSGIAPASAFSGAAAATPAWKLREAAKQEISSGRKTPRITMQIRKANPGTTTSIGVKTNQTGLSLGGQLAALNASNHGTRKKGSDSSVVSNRSTSNTSQIVLERRKNPIKIRMDEQGNSSAIPTMFQYALETRTTKSPCKSSKSSEKGKKRPYLDDDKGNSFALSVSEDKETLNKALSSSEHASTARRRTLRSKVCGNQDLSRSGHSLRHPTPKNSTSDRELSQSAHSRRRQTHASTSETTDERGNPSDGHQRVGRSRTSSRKSDRNQELSSSVHSKKGTRRSRSKGALSRKPASSTEEHPPKRNGEEKRDGTDIKNVEKKKETLKEEDSLVGDINESHSVSNIVEKATTRRSASPGKHRRSASPGTHRRRMLERTPSNRRMSRTRSKCDLNGADQDAREAGTGSKSEMKSDAEIPQRRIGARCNSRRELQRTSSRLKMQSSTTVDIQNKGQEASVPQKDSKSRKLSAWELREMTKSSPAPRTPTRLVGSRSNVSNIRSRFNAGTSVDEAVLPPAFQTLTTPITNRRIMPTDRRRISNKQVQERAIASDVRRSSVLGSLDAFAGSPNRQESQIATDFGVAKIEANPSSKVGGKRLIVELGEVPPAFRHLVKHKSNG